MRACYIIILIQSQMFSSLLSWFTYKPSTPQVDYFLCTYRSHINALLPTTYYNSDSGWGCMLRVGQMAIGNLLIHTDHIPLQSVIPLFWDNSIMPFSIQSITAMSKDIFPNKKQFQWYSPCECGFLLKQLLQKFSDQYRVNICNDNSIFKGQILRDRKKVLVLLMCRIGMEEPQLPYLQTVIQFMRMKEFFSIMGGTPRHAHLFLEVSEDGKYLGFLDPHKTYSSAQTQEELMAASHQYTSQLQWIKKQKIDSSMCIVFKMYDDQVDQFWQHLLQIKAKKPDQFYLYMEENRPSFDEEGIVEFLDDDGFQDWKAMENHERKENDEKIEKNVKKQEDPKIKKQEEKISKQYKSEIKKETTVKQLQIKPK